MHRTRIGEKSCKASVPRPDSPSAGGKAQSMNRIQLSTTEHGLNCECGSEGSNSITREFNNSYFKKANGMPIKALIDEEMSREKPIRRSSPSLIARLMGLDTLPSPGTLKPVKQAACSSNKTLYKDLHEKLTSHKTYLPQSSDDEYHEFKDVYEVVQVPTAEKQKGQINKKGVTSSRQQEIDKAFMQQSFNDSASLLTYTMRKEFDVENDFDLNMDFDLPFLQEPLKHPRHHASYRSILMASKDSPIASYQPAFRPEKNDGKCIYAQSDESHSLRKFAVKGYKRPSREHLCSLLKKVSESKDTEDNEYCVQPTQIVILKPSVDKAHQPIRPNLSGNSLNTLQYNFKNDLRFPADEIMEFCNEGEACQKLGQKMKGSRKMSKEITEPMKITIPLQRKKVLVDQRSFTTSRIMNGSKPQASKLYAYSDSSNHLSSCPAESKVTKEARKRLSERLKLTNHFQEMGFSSKASNTLAEMLALSDNEALKSTLDTVAIRKASERRVYREDNDLSSNLTRSKSLSDSSLISEKFQWKLRSRPVQRVKKAVRKVEDVSNWMFFDDNFIKKTNTSFRNLKHANSNERVYLDRKVNTVIEREIHVSSEKLKNSNDLGLRCDNQNMAIKLHRKSINSREEEKADFLSASQSNTDISLIDREPWFEKLRDITSSENDDQMTVCDSKEIASKEAIINTGRDQLHSPHCNISGSVCPESYKEADQPSPVSVLDMPSEEDFSTNCFQKINSDLQELRMQLQLLKQESTNSCTEDLDGLPTSDEEDLAGEPFPQYYADMLQEDREYSYVLDILIDGGILKAELDGLLFSTYQFSEHPVCLHTFDRLENKYKSVGSWPRSDRKLLFDLANSILTDIIEPKTTRQSKMAHAGLAESVWQAVVKQNKTFDTNLAENLSGLRWADLGYDVNEQIGAYVENVLQEDLLDELVTELICVKRL